MGAGMNMYGIFEQSPLDYSKREWEEIQEKLALKKKRRYNLEKVGENILGANKIKKLAWEC